MNVCVCEEEKKTPHQKTSQVYVAYGISIKCWLAVYRNTYAQASIYKVYIH